MSFGVRISSRARRVNAMRFGFLFLVVFSMEWVGARLDSNADASISNDVESISRTGEIDYSTNSTHNVSIKSLRIHSTKTSAMAIKEHRHNNNNNTTHLNNNSNTDLNNNNTTHVNNNNNKTTHVINKRKMKKKRKRNEKTCIHPRCKCKEVQRRVMVADCEGAFQLLPRFSGMSTIFHQISIRRANLSSIPSAAFKGIQTKELDLTGNRLRHSKIHGKAFRGLEKSLTILTLSDCRLTEVPTDSISILKNIKFLYLDRNFIRRIKSKSFSKNSKLKELYLSENKIASLDSMAFANLANLNLLVLSQNQLQFIELKTFSHLQRLTHLDLSGNVLNDLYPGTFDGILSLRWLKLDSNFIRRLKKYSFRGLKKLRNLKLENNPLQLIDDGTFENAPRLSYLSLDLANVSRITCKTFEGLGKLKTFNIGEFPATMNSHENSSNNFISNESKVNMTSTTFRRTTDLPSNVSSSHCGPRIFGSLANLERLSLSDYGGHFDGIHAAMLAEEINLRNLNVFVVPMRQCNCGKDWISQLTMLGSYVHGFCLDGRPLSCVKGSSHLDEGFRELNLFISRNINKDDDNYDDDVDDRLHRNDNNSFVPKRYKEKT